MNGRSQKDKTCWSVKKRTGFLLVFLILLLYDEKIKKNIYILSLQENYTNLKGKNSSSNILRSNLKYERRFSVS